MKALLVIIHAIKKALSPANTISQTAELHHMYSSWFHFSISELIRSIQLVDECKSKIKRTPSGRVIS